MPVVGDRRGPDRVATVRQRSGRPCDHPSRVTRVDAPGGDDRAGLVEDAEIAVADQLIRISCGDDRDRVGDRFAVARYRALKLRVRGDDGREDSRDGERQDGKGQAAAGAEPWCHGWSIGKHADDVRRSKAIGTSNGLGQDDGVYRAGACNIGPAEIERRRRLGLVELAAAGALAVGLVALDAPAWSRIAVFPLLAGSLVSLEQARRRFCAGFGFAGVRNFGPLGTPERVTSTEDRAIDRRASLLLFGYTAAAAGAITLLFVLAPV